jgi:hypothetical protein
MKPKLSVILPAIGGYHTVHAALAAWEAQTCRDSLEILILCPEPLRPQERASLPPGQIVVPVGSAMLHEARTLGVQQASAEYIMLAEDHCLPDPGWAEAILARMEEGWDVISPALRPGNRESPWAEGSFLLGYGEWMAPVGAGPVNIVPGWNVTVRASLLRNMAEELAPLMPVGFFVVSRLRDQGCRFYLENRAGMRHFDPVRLVRETSMLTVLGLGFGCFRTRSWSFPARFLYLFAGPAIACLHWKRALKHYRRAGSACAMRPSALAVAAALSLSWGIGESIGAWTPRSWILPHLWREEIKPPRSEDVERSNLRERLMPATAGVMAAAGRE